MTKEPSTGLVKGLGLLDATTLVMGSMIGSGIFLTVAGIFVLRRKRPEAERPCRALGYPVLPAAYIALAALIEVLLLVYKPDYTWPGLIIVLAGVPVYHLWKWYTGREVNNESVRH